MRRLFRFIRRLTRAPRTLITIRIVRDNILHNLRTFQRVYPGTKCAPVLKSNAYGHGLVDVARVLDGEGLPFFVVDSHYEARLVRIHGIRTPVLVIGYTLPETILLSRLRDVAFTIVDISQLEILAHTAKRPVRLHIKIDTGMHRQGIDPRDISHAIELLRGNPHLGIEGICSHFADAYTSTSVLTEKQINVWSSVVEEFHSTFPELPYIHLAATAGTAYEERFTANVHRLGIGLYGIDSHHPRSLGLKPALEVRTILTTVRDVAAGESVGYNATFVTDKPTRVATIPMGYNEGLDRRLSNPPPAGPLDGQGRAGGTLLVKGVPCPIIGRVSMNITSLDVTNVPDVKVGDEVVVISPNPEAPNSAQALAKQCGTIPYEILVHIPAYLRREVVWKQPTTDPKYQSKARYGAGN